jgi:hypothetical protein
MNRSPLFERRIIISLLKKQILGRRAYSDSIYMHKKSSNSSSVSSSIQTPTQCVTPTSETLVSELEAKVFSGIGC